jgi:S1-C subfamily serine protease
MQGDIVIAVDGVPVDSIPMLQSAIRDHEEGRIEFTVRRNGGQVALACQKP